MFYIKKCVFYIRIIIPKNQFNKFCESIVTIQESFDLEKVVNDESLNKTIKEDKNFLLNVLYSIKLIFKVIF